MQIPLLFGEFTLTEPTSIQFLPEWLSAQQSRLRTHLSPIRERDLENYSEQFSMIKEFFDSLPTRSVLFELYKITPDKLKQVFDDGFVALAHACESLLGFWSFQHAYKFKASLDGFQYAMGEGNFLLAFSCARSMFEEMAHFHFFLLRIEASHLKAVQLTEQEAPRSRKGSLPSDNWNRKFIASQLEIIKRLAKAVQGSDFDWKGWYRQTAESYEMPDVDIVKLVGEHTEMRKTHINDCLDALDKKSQLKATEMYNLLSEMVHPNFGSNSLVIVTRNRVSEVVGEAVLSSNPKTVEAAAWFFELAAAPLGQMFELERSCIVRSQALLKFYQRAAVNLVPSRSTKH